MHPSYNYLLNACTVDICCASFMALALTQIPPFLSNHPFY